MTRRIGTDVTLTIGSGEPMLLKHGAFSMPKIAAPGVFAGACMPLEMTFQLEPGSAEALKDWIASLPTVYAILFDPTKDQVDAIIAKYPQVIVFPFVTVPAQDVPDMNWIGGYMAVVKPMHLGNFKESCREKAAQAYVRHCLPGKKLVQVGV